MRTPNAENLTLKLVILAAIGVGLMLPLSLVTNIISERAQLQEQTARKIAQSWGSEQVLVSPTLSIPFKPQNRSRDVMHIIPDQADVHTRLETETRRHGIYEVPVYRAITSLDLDFNDWKDIFPANAQVHWDEAFLTVGMSEPSGIDGASVLVNGQNVRVKTGVKDTSPITSGVHAPVSLEPEQHLAVTVDLDVRGSQGFQFIPAAMESHIEVKSPWDAPSFEGDFLPSGLPESFAQGFTANWKMSSLNSDFPKAYTNDTHFGGNSLRVRLVDEVNNYSKTMRSTKYGVLFVLMVFMVLIGIQLVRKQWLHPLQLAMFGLGIVLFYLLLLSLSEVVGFNLAYLLGAVAMIGLLSWYLAGIYRSRKAGWVTAGGLTALYAVGFTLVQLVMYSMLVGSVTLFVLLAVMMALSRRMPQAPTHSDPTPPPVPDNLQPAG